MSRALKKDSAKGIFSLSPEKVRGFKINQRVCKWIVSTGHAFSSQLLLRNRTRNAAALWDHARVLLKLGSNNWHQQDLGSYTP